MNNQLKKLKQVAAKFPNQPGVYFWLGEKKEILYIGRATSLKKRVSQYFRQDLEPRLAEMVAAARQIKFQAVPTLLDAVILEANLIKKHWPKYNVKDKDNRSFVYAVIPRGEFVHPMIARERELKKFPAAKNKIFGPYQSQYLLTNALKLIRRIFPYGTCRPNSGRPCFDYQIGLCPGSCVGAISAKDYQNNIDNIVLLLSGQRRRLLAKLKKEHPEQAEALKRLQDVSLITRDELSAAQSANRLEGYDISHWSGQEAYGAMTVFVGGRPDKSSYRLFKIKEAPAGDDLRALAEVIKRRFNHSEWERPDLILIDGGQPQLSFVAKELTALNIGAPIVGLSKYGGDRLVFPAGASQSFKKLTQSIKKTLLELRDEAHRFGNRARRSRFGKRLSYRGGVCKYTN